MFVVWESVCCNVFGGSLLPSCIYLCVFVVGLLASRIASDSLRVVPICLVVCLFIYLFACMFGCLFDSLPRGWLVFLFVWLFGGLVGCLFGWL